MRLNSTRQRVLLFVTLLGVTSLFALLINPITRSLAQTTHDDPIPPPPSIGADVPLTYFGPAPSEVQKELIGPYKLLKAGQVDEKAGTVTLPLYQGHLPDGRNVWYILTDTDDKANADALGLNFSSKLTYANVGHAVRDAVLQGDGTLTFLQGTVDFSPEHKLVPGDAPNAFPPKEAQPGAVGDSYYSPLVRVTNAGGHIYNAPMVAFDVSADQISFCDSAPDYSLVHDHVVHICPKDQTVTLSTALGFSFARPVLYLSTESNDPVAATLENVTLVQTLTDVPVGRDDSAFSAVERLFAFPNGPTGKDNPQRQGFNSAITDGGGPLNVLGGIPTIATDYSPLWDVNVAVWTQEAIDKGYRSRLTEEFQILGFAEKGWITGPDGKKFGSSGIIVNCPVVFRYR